MPLGWVGDCNSYMDIHMNQHRIICSKNYHMPIVLSSWLGMYQDAPKGCSSIQNRVSDQQFLQMFLFSFGTYCVT